MTSPLLSLVIRKTLRLDINSLEIINILLLTGRGRVICRIVLKRRKSALVCYALGKQRKGLKMVFKHGKYALKRRPLAPFRRRVMHTSLRHGVILLVLSLPSTLKISR